MISNLLIFVACLYTQKSDGREAERRSVQFVEQFSADHHGLQGRSKLLTAALFSIETAEACIREGQCQGQDLAAFASPTPTPTPSPSATPPPAQSSTGSCPWYSITCIWNNIKEAAASVITGALQATGLVPDQAPAPLGGASVTTVNIVFCATVAAMLLCVGLGKMVDNRWPAPFGKGHPPAWLMCWLVASYGLLVPGIMCILFSFNIWATFTLYSVVTVNFNLTQTPAGVPSAISESMLSFIKTLWTSGGRVGAVLVITYAIVIPVAKILLLIIGEYLRNSTDARSVAFSRWCIKTVQLVSKWACPDMFAYILMLYLFRKMDHPPTMIATASLEIGFISFSMFCLNSTFASMLISLPELPAACKDRKGNVPTPRRGDANGESCCIRWFGQSGVKFIAVLLSFGFFVGWSTGIFMPCMSLKLELSELNISASIRQILTSLHFQKLIDSTVTLWDCLLATVSWLADGEAATIMAFLLMGIFVIALPALDVLLLLVTAFTSQPVYVLNQEPERFQDDEAAAERSPHFGLTLSHYIGHLQMLDVFVMGIVVVCASGTSYRSQGVSIMMQSGIYWLIAAEVAHYALYYLVLSISSHHEE